MYLIKIILSVLRSENDYLQVEYKLLQDSIKGINMLLSNLVKILTNSFSIQQKEIHMYEPAFEHVCQKRVNHKCDANPSGSKKHLVTF